MIFRGFHALLCLLAILAVNSRAAAEPLLHTLTIVVPGVEGGGFDQTAQAVRHSLLAEGLVSQVDLVHSPGAGGLIALAQFESRGDDAVFVGGTSIIGAAAVNKSMVSLADLTPVRQLNEIGLVIAVRKDSPVKSLADLIELVRTDPSRFEWVGGSHGSPDQLLLWAISEKLNMSVDRVAYIAASGGGTQVPERLLRGRHLAAISSFEEFSSFQDKDKLLLLAVSSARRLPGINLPTMREAGFDLAVSDWKGAFVSPKMAPEKQARIAELFTRLVASDTWRDEQIRQGWLAPAQGSAEFGDIIEADQIRIAQLLQHLPSKEMPDAFLLSLLQRPWKFAVFGFSLAVILILIVAWQRRGAVRRNREIKQANEAIEVLRARIAESSAGERDGIAKQFAEWGLSSAEIDIAWMILKGSQFKEIADARGTSERTVRQQAQGIYAKSGTINRAEFSAFFIEELCF